MVIGFEIFGEEEYLQRDFGCLWWGEMVTAYFQLTFFHI